MTNQEKELNADGYLKNLLEVPSVEGYIAFNCEGIIMWYAGRGLNHMKAVHYGALLTDYWNIVKKTLSTTLKGILNGHKEAGQDFEIEYIRMRTKK